MSISKTAKEIFLCVFSALFLICLCLSGFFKIISKAEETSSTQAYVMHEGRSTYGFWYTGLKGTKEYAQNRIYGKDGVFLAGHGEVQNAMPTAGDAYKKNAGYQENLPGMEDNSDSFTGDSGTYKYLHYVEYPEYVENMSLSGMNVTYWNDSQYTVSEVIKNTSVFGRYAFKRLLYIDFDDPGNPEKRIGTPALKAENVQVKVEFNDEEWHVVTLYIGLPYAYLYSYRETLLNVRDLDGNIILSTIIKDPDQAGCYVSLAVKGSAIFELDENGYGECCLDGIFFDSFTENPQIGWSNLNAQLEAPRTIQLSWENFVDTSVTNIYRRKAGENSFTYLASVEAGVNTYTDTDTSVNTKYEYTLVSGEERVFNKETHEEWDPYDYTGQNTSFEYTPDVVDYQLLVPENKVSCETAPYISSYIEFEQNNLGCQLGGILFTNVKVYKNTIYDENGNIIEKGEPYQEALVKFKLIGENASSFVNGSEIPNMQTNIYSCYTSKSGVAQLIYEPEYAGDYTILASIDVIQDQSDPTGLSGIDGYSQEQEFVVYKSSEADEYVPALYTITDAVKPGGAFTVTGNGISAGGYTQIAYAPYNGEQNRVYDENISGLKYIAENDIIVEDIEYNCGVTAIFPETAEAGIYDIWIKNVYGWSSAITMNEVRGLFMNVDGGYEGLPIEIVGRNFFGSEYGMGENSEQNVRVKLVRIGNLYGEQDNITCTRIVPINQGIKWAAKDSFVGEDIPVSNQFRIEFSVPNIPTGQYKIFVSSDGLAFRQVQSDQIFSVYEKKAVNYSNSHFAPQSDMIGNDPLNLKLFWAQNYSWNKVETVDNQYIYADRTYNFDEDAEGKFEIVTTGNGTEVAIEDSINPTQRTLITRHVQNKIDALSAAGGGILYFPKGFYYLGSISLKSNVVLLGESVEDTVIIATFIEEELNTQAFITIENTRNCGLARMTLTQYKKELKRTPNFYINGNHNTFLFLTDLYFDLFQPDQMINRNYNRGLCSFTHSNYFVYQNNVYHGEYAALSLIDYPIENISNYVIIRNCDFQMKGAHLDMGYNYSTVENTRMVSGSAGHGWAGKNNAYCAYNLIQDVGYKQNCNNEGEAFYFEPPTSIFSLGNIIGASERTFSVKVTGGQRINEQSILGYTQCAVMITNGKGVGQIRYFDLSPVNNYGNEYRLCDWEEDWDVVPDDTSQFVIFEPLANNTLYKNTIKYCAKSMMFFGNAYDCIMYGNTSIESEGYQIWGCANASQVISNYYCRIENNVLRGISSGTGNGGIEILTGDYTADIGFLAYGIVIRNNQLYDLRNPDNLTGSSEFGEYRGISINTLSDSESGRVANIRHILIEGNYVENCDYGVRIDAKTYGICLKDNTFSMIGCDVLGLEETGLPLDYNPIGSYAQDYITILNAKNVKGINNLYFKVNGITDETLSGSYTFQEMLPVLEGSFVGWSYEDKNMQDYTRDDIVTSNEGGVATLYPVYGYTISLHYNYERNDGEDIYRNTVYMLNEHPDSLGRPVRVGYTFDGWFYDPECTQKYDATDTIDKSLVLYAKWIAKSDGEGESDIAENETPKSATGNKDYLWIVAGGVVALLAIGTSLIIGGKR